MPKVAIIRFPGSNSHRESLMALNNAGLEAEFFFWNEPIDALADYDAYLIPGGFSYEDRSRAGVIAAQSALIKKLLECAGNQKPVLGICNGAQILLESNALLEEPECIALEPNRRRFKGRIVETGYFNDARHLTRSCAQKRTPFTFDEELDHATLVPFAHAEGSFQCSPNTLRWLQSRDQIVFRYSDAKGKAQTSYPINPNGSVDGIAALCNPNGNILAIMPHPERKATTNGLFRSLARYLSDPWAMSAPSPKDGSLPALLSDARGPIQQTGMLVRIGLKTTDHHGFSVTRLLRQAGFNVSVKRQDLWAMSFASDASSEETLKRIIHSGEICNLNKEVVYTEMPTSAHAIAVWPRANIEGENALSHLQERHLIHSLKSLKKGSIWLIECNMKMDEHKLKALISTHLFHHPYSCDCIILDS